MSNLMQRLLDRLFGPAVPAINGPVCSVCGDSRCGQHAGCLDDLSESCGAKAIRLAKEAHDDD